MIERKVKRPPEFAYPIDEWKMVEAQFYRRLVPQAETMFAIGNGYLGMRGNFEEGTSGPPAADVCQRLPRDVADPVRRARLTALPRPGRRCSTFPTARSSSYTSMTNRSICRPPISSSTDVPSTCKRARSTVASCLGDTCRQKGADRVTASCLLRSTGMWPAISYRGHRAQCHRSRAGFVATRQHRRERRGRLRSAEGPRFRRAAACPAYQRVCRRSGSSSATGRATAG